MPHIDSVIAKLKEAVQCKTDGELAKSLKIAPSTISTWRKRDSIPYDKVEEVAKRLDIPFIWFFSGLKDGQFESPQVLMPILRRISSGFPAEVLKEDCDGNFSVPSAPQGAFVLKMPDESMSPTLRQGDHLMFVPTQDLKGGELVIFSDEWGKVGARRYRQKNGQFFLVGENSEFSAIETSDEFQVFGKVVSVWREIKV